MNRMKKGFSLVEVLIAVAIFGVIAAVSLDLFLASVKSANKTRIVNQVTQNGQQISTVMEALIRNAKTAITCYNPPNDSTGETGCSNNPAPPADDPCTPSAGHSCNQLILTDSDGLTWKLVYIDPTATSNGYLEIRDSNNRIFMASDTNPISGVDVQCPCTGPNQGGFIKLDKINSAAPDSILFRFVVNQGLKASSRQDFQANVTVERAVTLKAVE